jgi:plastocyanin
VSRRTQRVVVVLSTAAVGSFMLAACVAANTPAAQPNPTFSTDLSATPGLAGTGSAPPMSAMPQMSMSPSRTEADAPVGPNAITIDGFAFAPATLTVPPGSTVTWTNGDEDPHTVVAGNGSFHSRALGAGGTYSFTFPTAGTFDYICSIHPFMHGTVVVTP